MMKSILAGVLLGVTLCLTMPKAWSQTFSKKDFEKLTSLVGLWKMETSRGTLYEEWRLEAADRLAGRSFKIKGADTMVLEQVELFLQDGKIIYSPAVRDQNKGQRIPFRLIAQKEQQYVFENREHDYPQRIIYDLVSKSNLHARIEGTRSGKEMGSDFNYSRVR